MPEHGLGTTVYGGGCPAITCVDCVDCVNCVAYVTSTSIGPAYARAKGDTVGTSPPLYPRVTKESTLMTMPLRGIASTRRGYQTSIVVLEEDQDTASIIVSWIDRVQTGKRGASLHPWCAYMQTTSQRCTVLQNVVQHSTTRSINEARHPVAHVDTLLNVSLVSTPGAPRARTRISTTVMMVLLIQRAAQQQ